MDHRFSVGNKRWTIDFIKDVFFYIMKNKRHSCSRDQLPMEELSLPTFSDLTFRNFTFFSRESLRIRKFTTASRLAYKLYLKQSMWHSGVKQRVSETVSLRVRHIIRSEILGENLGETRWREKTQNCVCSFCFKNNFQKILNHMSEVWDKQRKRICRANFLCTIAAVHEYMVTS